MVDRRRIRDICCGTRDAILWTSFTWEELRLIANRAKQPLEYPRAPEGADRALVEITALHRACHFENAFSERVEEFLNTIHADAIARVQMASESDVLEWCALPQQDLPATLAGLLWAVASDPRDELRSAEGCLLWRSQVEGYRTLAFGKVEMIHV